MKTHILNGKYLDSVKLMLISKELKKLTGIEEAVAITATVENKAILEATGMLTTEFQNAAPTSIYIAVHAALEADADLAIKMAQEWIANGIPGAQKSSGTETKVHSIEGALNIIPDANLALISVAGKYAAREARKALEAGLHVMLFSDNVTIEQELSLKQYAVSRGLLMMGPDCGTAILSGVPLAFANGVRNGKIGMVSAAGTGLQAVSSEIHNLGGGISQAFGTGGRDGKAEIGGLMLLQCLDYLFNDPNTEVIVVIAKLPHQSVVDHLLQRVQQTTKPVVVNFLKPCSLPKLANLHVTSDLTQTAMQAYSLLYKSQVQGTRTVDSTDMPMPTSPLRKYLRGLYSGGTLCYEAQAIFTAATGLQCLSNAPIESENILNDVWQSAGHSIIDLGADEFTVGRPHPMIDYSLRLKMLESEAQRKEVAVLLFDVVLGYGSHPAPHLELTPVIRQIKMDTCIVMIACVIGTDLDPQNRTEVMAALREAGAVVCTSNALATQMAATVIKYVSRNQ